MPDDLIDNPTWQTPIRSFFNDIDISHMLAKTDIDLSDYDSVVANKDAIFARVSSHSMPRPPSPPWSDDFIAIFKTWMDKGCPQS
jgi:hypothetical protein